MAGLVPEIAPNVRLDATRRSAGLRGSLSSGGATCRPVSSIRATDSESSQPLIAGVFGGLTRRFRGSLGRALAAGNLDRLAAGDLVPGIVGHLPEEISRRRGDDRDHEERRREIVGGRLSYMAQHHGGFHAE